MVHCTRVWVLDLFVSLRMQCKQHVLPCASDNFVCAAGGVG